jgi:hypothetical protein
MAGMDTRKKRIVTIVLMGLASAYFLYHGFALLFAQP